jgi:hypothetical protein
VTYTILMNGDIGGVRAGYDVESGNVLVIGGDGIIIYRGFYEDADLRAIIDDGLAALDVSPVPDLPITEHRFDGGFPNPFNPSTRLAFSLAPESTPQPARLEIVDLQGRLVQVLLDETATSGRQYEAVWNGRDLTGRAVASGVYLARLRVGDWQATRAVTMVK